MAQQMTPEQLANLPAAMPPLGVSNFDDPVSRAYQAHIAMGVCIGLTTTFLLLRIFVKLAVIKAWEWDDWTLIIGWCCITAHDFVAFQISGPGKWLGIHMWDIRAMSISKQYLQLVLAGINLYAAGAFFVKLSLFLLYLRLFKPDRTTRYLIYGGIAACTIFYPTGLILNCVFFMPPMGQADTTENWLAQAQKSGHKPDILAIAQGAFGIASDVFLLVLPIQCVFQLHLPTARKWGISIVFMTGLVAIGCSIGTTYQRTTLLHTTDNTWDSLPVWILSTCEISAGILCSCMPICASLFKKSTGSGLKLPPFLSFSRFSSKGASKGSYKNSSGYVSSSSGERSTKDGVTRLSYSMLGSKKDVYKSWQPDDDIPLNEGHASRRNESHLGGIYT